MDEQYYEYRTGRTSPNKNRNGIIAALLICVIFLAGIFSALGLLNIHLFRQQQEQPHTPVSFSQEDSTCPTFSEASLELSGMVLQELPVVYQKMYDLPEGLYVCHVDVDSAADALGIAPGDVVTHLEGKPLSQLDDLLDTLENPHGKTAKLTIFQDGQCRQFTLPMNGEQE